MHRGVEVFRLIVNDSLLAARLTVTDQQASDDDDVSADTDAQRQNTRAPEHVHVVGRQYTTVYKPSKTFATLCVTLLVSIRLTVGQISNSHFIH